MSVKGEANLAGALVLLREYICSVSKDLLIQKFEVSLTANKKSLNFQCTKVTRGQVMERLSL